MTYTWEITKGEEYASIKSSTGTAVVTGKNATTSTQSATVSVTATYNGVQKSATQTISIAAASSDNPDNPVAPDNPDTPDTPSAQTKITITYSTEHGTAPDAKTVELTDSLYTITSDDLPALTEKGYSFGGWAVSATCPPTGGGSTTPDTGSTTTVKAGETITENTTLYAVWTANTDTAYTVKHYLQNVALDGYEEQTSDAESKTGTTGGKTSAEAKTYAGFTAKSYEQETIAGDGSTVVSIYYDRKEITLTFDTDGGSEIAPITGKYGTAVTAPAEPTKEGVIFSYWDPRVPETFPEEDTTYTAQWVYPSDATPYKVRHMVRALDGDDYELYEEETLFGKAGKETNAVAKNIEGFTAGSVYQYPFISSTGDTVVTIYYSRKYISLTFASMTNYGYSTNTYVSGYYGAELTPPDNPERSGYTFAGWSPEVPKTFPSENTTYTAQWDDGSRTYKVRHFKETLDGAYELYEEETLTGKAGEYTNAYSSSYDGFTAKSFDQEIIAEDESTVVSIYYDLDTFTLKFDTKGGSEIASVSGKYGAPVPEIENPSKAGYTFAGWVFLTGSSSSVTASTPVIELPDTFPAYNRTYTAKWTANTDTKYTVKHYKRNLEDDEYTLADTEVLTGTTDSWVPTVSAKTYEGFSTSSNDGSYKKIAGDGSTVVSVYYNRNLIVFKLDLDGGIGITMAYGRYGAAVTAPENPTKKGYVFAGWDTEGGTLASVFEKDTTYTAVWTWSRVEGITITVENQDDITVTREDKGNSLIFTAEDCDSYAWYLDDEKKGSDKTYSLDTSSLAAGTYTLALEAEKDGEWYSYFAQIKVSK